MTRALPITKTQRLREFIATGDWPRALSLANTFRHLGPHRDTIRLAHECRVHPRFYRGLGRDPEAATVAGIAALRQLYPATAETKETDVPRYAVTITETVIVRYAPIVVDAANKAEAMNAAEAIRCDGGLDDPETETVQDVSMTVILHRPTDTPPQDASTSLFVTAAGHEALASAQTSVED
jgi:hypothetical protein